jgi:hypothetical protein
MFKGGGFLLAKTFTLFGDWLLFSYKPRVVDCVTTLGRGKLAGLIA